jgi:hypothetical protein
MHQRRPNPLVNKRDLALDQATDENPFGVADGPRDLEDEVALRVRPPTSTDGGANNGLSERGNRASTRLEDNPVLPDECNGFPRSH